MSLYTIINQEHLQTFLFWLTVAYAVVLCSMFLDMIAAYIKCKRVGRKWLSWKQKETATKAEKYLFPMLALSIVDLLVLTITRYPVFTILLAFVNSLTEWISIFEKSHNKKEILETAHSIEVLMSNKEQIGNILIEWLKSKGYDVERKDKNKEELPNED